MPDAECLSCRRAWAYGVLRLTARDAPVATCPDCGGHRFEPITAPEAAR